MKELSKKQTNNNMHNHLYLVVTSNLKDKVVLSRFAKSVDLNNHIHIVFVNQADDMKSISETFSFNHCDLHELFTGKQIPLARARNKALDYIYSDICKSGSNDSLVMFVDDDAWFPKETLVYIQSMEEKAISLKTIDPELNKSFSKVKKTRGEIKGYHLVKDIVSICMVVPLNFLRNHDLHFNEKLGLGNMISQGEESLFVYHCHQLGLKFYYDNHLIFHPYKKTFNIKNFYSLSYFWGLGLANVSIIFLKPALLYLIKYTIALGLIFKDKRYIEIFANVWRGFIDGCHDKYRILK